MKSTHDRHGNLNAGTSLLQDLLGDKKKTQQLLDVLDKLDMHIVQNADVKDKETLWIRKNS